MQMETLIDEDNKFENNNLIKDNNIFQEKNNDNLNDEFKTIK